MDDLPGEWAVFAVCCLVSFLAFSFRAAVTRFSWAKLDELTASRATKQRVEEALDEAPAAQAACTVLGVFGVVGATVIIALEAAARSTGPTAQWHFRFAAAFSVAALAALVFTSLLPGVVARRYAERIVLLALPWLVSVVNVPSRLWRALSRSRAEEPSGAATEVSLELNGDHSAESAEEEARELYRSAVRIQSIEVSEIMTPRTDMVSVEDTNTLEEARSIAVQCGHSRLPVFHETRDNIVGILYAKDLLQPPDGDPAHTKVTQMMRKPYFVPETKVIDELLEEFQRRKVHVGVVLDEYGGTAGLVTVEDILEEIVGEIRDEYDQEEEVAIRQLDDLTAEVDARVHVEEINEAMHLDLPEDGDYDTVGGFISFTIGRIPRPAEQFRYGNARFTVLAADARKISRVKVEILGETEKGG